jgi:glycosyltransferase involved in cell wall biosynthesis/SAM-dependent methyltransferase
MKLAVFSPLPPAKSGIADYCQALLPELAKHFDIDAFPGEGYEPSGLPPGVSIPFRRAGEFRPEAYDAVLYQLGNNSDHAHVYDAAIEHPGVVVLHEFNLHHLFADVTIRRGDWAGYLREVEHEGGAEALAYARRAATLEVGPDYDLPMNRRILERCRGVIVHSRFMVDQVASTGIPVPVTKIPHGVWLPEITGNTCRARLGLDESTPLIGIFGFLKPYKRITEALRAMQRLVRLDSRVKMILVGQEHPDYPIRRLIDQLGIHEHVRLLGYVPTEELEQYIATVDICLNLRYPTVGETSGTLQRAFGLGRAVIVSEVGSFAELPGEICLKVPVGEGEVDAVFEYLQLLITYPEVGRQMGARARQYVASQCSWDHVAQRYADWVRAVVEGKAGQLQAASGVDAAQAVLAQGGDAQGEAALEAGTPAVSAKTNEAKVHAAEPFEPFVMAAVVEIPDDVNPSPPAARQTEACSEEVLKAIERDDLADYIRAFSFDDPGEAAYVESHLTRLIRTLEITPPGTDEDRILEMGAYMQITPALKTRLGYGDVRGSYLGKAGDFKQRAVRSRDGESFACRIDNFDAEKDRYPYPDDFFSTVLCCELLEHLYDDPMHMMAEINRILKPGGHLVLSTPNICSTRAVGAALLGYHPGLFHQYVRPDKDGAVDPRHAREYAPRDVHALLDAAGFAIVLLETGPYLESPAIEQEWVQKLLERYELANHLRGDVIYGIGKKTGGVKSRYPPELYTGAAE